MGGRMKSVYIEKSQWAWSREIQEMKGEVLWISLFRGKSAFWWHFTTKLDRMDELAKLTKMDTSSIGMFYKENMSSINLFHTKGFGGLAASSCFSRSDMKITEIATAILVPIAIPRVCAKCFPLNLKEFSSSMSRISSRKSLVEIGNLCS